MTQNLLAIVLTILVAVFAYCILDAYRTYKRTLNKRVCQECKLRIVASAILATLCIVALLGLPVANL